MMSNKYVLAIDAGTSSVRTILYDYYSREVASSQSEFTQITPEPGWLEHDPLEIWNLTKELMNETIKKANLTPKDIAAIGLACQRSTVVAWNKQTGEPIYNALVWQDLRTSDRCKELSDLIGMKVSPLSAYTKIEWLLQNVPNCQEGVENGDVLMGTLDTFLVWHLTGREAFVTDPSNALTTMMWLPPIGDWSPEIAQLINMPTEKLAEVVSTSEVYGTTLREDVGAEIPVAAVTGDQSAAMFGHLCREPSSAKATYGTSIMVNVHTGNEWMHSDEVSSMALWRLYDQDEFCIEGMVISGGASMELVKELNIIDTIENGFHLFEEATDSGGISYIPALQGLGTPYMETETKGTLFGLTRSSKKKHVVRAVLEGIAFRTRQVVEALNEASPFAPIETLQVDGGMAANDAFLQMQADILGITIKRPHTNQVSSLGIAYLAGLAVGYWESEDEIKHAKVTGTIFTPSANAENMQHLFKRWEHHVETVRTLSKLEYERS